MLKDIRNGDARATARTISRALRAWHELHLAAGGATWQPDPGVVVKTANEALRGISRAVELLTQMEEDAKTLRDRARTELAKRRSTS